MRRLFSFLFRHEWKSTGEMQFVPVGHAMVRDRCRRCGLVSEWRYLVDQEAFRRMYRSRGCKGGTK